jgi:glycosyltransferase involved in cell wall biosynthesis
MKFKQIDRIRIGVDISQLVHTNYLAGPQRVLLETLKSLLKISKEENIEIHGINLSGRSTTSGLEAVFTNPILKKICFEVSNLDIILLIDANNHYVIEKIHKSNFKGMVVSILHDVLPLKHDEWYKFKNRPNYSSEFRFYMMRMDRYSQLIISPSQENVEDCLKYLPKRIVEKIKVIPFGSFWDSEIPQNKNGQHSQKRIICVNTLEPKKGHKDILDAFDILVKKDPEWILYLIGKEGWNAEDLKQRIIKNHFYGRNLFWFENLDDLQILKLYKQCSIAISAAHAEGFGLTVEEGLSQGMKLICRDIPVFRERSHNNLYFFSGGGRNLVNKIEFVFSQDCHDYQNIKSMEDFTQELLSYILLQLGA